MGKKIRSAGSTVGLLFSATWLMVTVAQASTLSFPKFETPAGVDPKDSVAVATAYLSSNAQVLGFSMTDLAAPTVRESLVGRHLRFVQNVNGTPVMGGEIVVSVDRDSGSILKVYSTLAPAAAMDQFHMRLSSNEVLTRISRDQAIDRAWKHLRVHGALGALPTAQSVLSLQGLELVSAYQVVIDTQAPAGTWEVLVDSQTGRILSLRDQRIHELKRGGRAIAPTTPDFRAYVGAIADRKALEEQFMDLSQIRSSFMTSDGTPPRTVNGRGLVFNPDPLTLLKRADLNDDSPAEAFEGAYVEKTLLDLSVVDDGSTALIGPWVRIVDLDSPTSIPSRRMDGVWSAKRGDDAFDDVMVYFHIDQSQRYMQSLGFVGDKGIQYNSIGADSNGAGGADNSYFIPSSNYVSFGHGCVNDSEDADVILHEYGHAIHYSINPSWGGGDAGAIGEGFGDYWAGSYSLSVAEDPSAEMLNKVFNWDAAGDCWPGRRLNVTTAAYDPRRTYGAHQPVGNFESDELWSTPLFSARKALLAMGIAGTEADRIVLEAHFGLGNGVTMPQLAKATLAAAKALYPDGPHRQAFLDAFAQNKILNPADPSLP